VQRGNVQDRLYHLHDELERDMKMRMVLILAKECLVWRDPEFKPWLLGDEVLRDVEA